MAEEGGLVARIPAGLTDAALASLATFLTGLVGVNALDDVTRGVYAVFFTAFLAGTVIPTQLALLPAETAAVSAPAANRLNSIVRSSRIGALVGPAALLPVALAVVATVGRADWSDVLALAVTAGLASVVSPIQDHLRRMLHLAGYSWKAATTSGAQLGGVLVGLGLFYLLDTPTSWIPLGALAFANVCSTAYALVVAKRAANPDDGADMALLSLARAGKWLLLMALGPRLTFFAASLLVTVLAGPEALGFAEAARIATQPLYVLSLGLEAAVRPHAMTAASEKDLIAARKHRRVYYPVIGGFAVGFMVWCGFDWIGNPFSYLLPAAYAVEGLVILTAVSSVMRGALLPHMAEMLGARAERRLAVITVAVTPVQVLVALTAGITEAFARPLGATVDYVGRLVALERYRPVIFSPPEPKPPPG